MMARGKFHLGFPWALFYILINLKTMTLGRIPNLLFPLVFRIATLI